MGTGRKVWAYVFIETRQPRKVVRKVRRIRGVVKADGLFGTPGAGAIVEGDDIASMDAVIDKIALIPEILRYFWQRAVDRWQGLLWFLHLTIFRRMLPRGHPR